MRQYLQVTDSKLDGTSWVEDGMNINKKIYTYFLCKRCFHHHKQTETFVKEI